MKVMKGMAMFGIRYLGNTHLPHNKKTASMPAIQLPPPREVLLPLSQHIGAPATSIVNAGDYVKIGQKIAESSGYVSSPIYATVSGTVGKTEEYLRSDGRKVPAIRIISDGEMSVADCLNPPSIETLDDLINAAKESGIVGLGGAGFPTSVKLDALKKGQIDTLVLNGAECEPYITSDTRTMLDKSDKVRFGVELILKFAPSIKKVIIGIEKNKPDAISRMRDTFSDKACVEIKPLPPKYPQGAEKVLIYNTTRRVVPEGKLPADVGIIVLNITSLAMLAGYILTGMPLVSRELTVDGDAVKFPKNIKAPIGTPIKDILEFCGVNENIGKVLYGGPMMGSAASSPYDPIIKTTGALTVFTKHSSEAVEETHCIHCGKCSEACPHLLTPRLFSKALALENEEEKIAMLEKNKIMLCVECGSCSYVCPAGCPLVLNNKLAKAEYRSYIQRMSELKN